ncbi:MAG TPA: recombinase family protein [Pyrinomonadaceae bacterium]|nr:recombinase family protein [Pyrinomonadaceae bacterium]
MRRAHVAGLRSRRTGQAMSRSNVHRLLQSRVYTGDFDWNNRTYRGSHEPLISTALFERVQEILGLKWEHVDFDQKTIYIAHTKTGRPRRIPMSKPV